MPSTQYRDRQRRLKPKPIYTTQTDGTQFLKFKGMGMGRVGGKGGGKKTRDRRRRSKTQCKTASRKKKQSDRLWEASSREARKGKVVLGKSRKHSSDKTRPEKRLCCKETISKRQGRVALPNDCPSKK